MNGVKLEGASIHDLPEGGPIEDSYRVVSLAKRSDRLMNFLLFLHRTVLESAALPYNWALRSTLNPSLTIAHAQQARHH